MTPQNSGWQWRPTRVWWGLLLYWFVAMVGIGVFYLFDKAADSRPWIVLSMLVLLIVCMSTERGEWALWKCIGFVFMAWFLEALLSAVGRSIVGISLLASLGEHLVDRGITFLGTIPSVIWAMRRSRMFVRRRAGSQ